MCKQAYPCPVRLSGCIHFAGLRFPVLREEGTVAAHLYYYLTALVVKAQREGELSEVLWEEVRRVLGVWIKW